MLAGGAESGDDLKGTRESGEPFGIEGGGDEAIKLEDGLGRELAGLENNSVAGGKGGKGIGGGDGERVVPWRNNADDAERPPGELSALEAQCRVGMRDGLGAKDDGSIFRTEESGIGGNHDIAEERFLKRLAGFCGDDSGERFPFRGKQLGEAAEKAILFARLSPAHKERVIRALRGKGHVVGFLGDGINDAPALRAADVGISVDTATDIAKESADLILLDKDLMVLDGGVIEGRKVFANIVKYIRMGASSNFGNMFSVLGASAFLPFLPMAPIQVLTNNLLYDFSQIPIPADAVDEEQVTQPRPWKIEEIRRFILFIGPVSSIFDYTTFFVMLWVFNCWAPTRAPLFQTAWFVESLMTQTLIIHVIRTNKIPFLQSRASWALTSATLAIMAVGIWLPYSPLASALGFTRLPPLYWPILILTLLSYMSLTQIIKVWLLRKHWI